MLQTLTTPRGKTLSGTPWQVYPRPQMRRDSYINLNGEWDFAVSSGKPETFDMRILVPFCPESRLSGIGRHFEEGAPLWYRRRFLLHEGFRRERVLLHIGAADQIAEVFVNGQHLCRHEGGYASFCVDITEALAEENELVIRCTDDLHDQAFPYGKQVMNRGGMWYTPVSGIWQTVWLESVPGTYIENLNIENHGASVTISTVPPLEGTASVEQLGQFPLEHGQVTIAPENPHFWCPDDPYLYRFTVETAQDKVESYFAIRSLEIKKVGGYPRLCLNGKPYFFHGLLDQGYWPEGLLTAPAPESYADDILAMKRLGFNTLRKHIKVEPEEFYYQCDRLGMIVWQDMVNNGSYRYFRDTVLPTIGIQKWNDQRLHLDERSRNAFRQGAADAVNQLKNHPCICYWTIFNEGWGQFDSQAQFERLRALDDSRFIDTTSGWFRCGQSDVESLHVYFKPVRLPKSEKPLVLSEFGGYSYKPEGHVFNTEKTYGYRFFKEQPAFMDALERLYLDEIVPAREKGLCAAIYTQLSDVEDETNGLVSYDRAVCKADEARMCAIAEKLKFSY